LRNAGSAESLPGIRAALYARLLLRSRARSKLGRNEEGGMARIRDEVAADGGGLFFLGLAILAVAFVLSCL
jgi:hypothetical protein